MIFCCGKWTDSRPWHQKRLIARSFLLVSAGSWSPVGSVRILCPHGTCPSRERRGPGDAAGLARGQGGHLWAPGEKKRRGPPVPGETGFVRQRLRFISARRGQRTLSFRRGGRGEPGGAAGRLRRPGARRKTTEREQSGAHRTQTLVCARAPEAQAWPRPPSALKAKVALPGPHRLHQGPRPDRVLPVLQVGVKQDVLVEAGIFRLAQKRINVCTNVHVPSAVRSALPGLCSVVSVTTRLGVFPPFPTQEAPPDAQPDREHASRP